MLTIEPSYKVLQQLLMTDEKYHFISLQSCFYCCFGELQYWFSTLHIQYVVVFILTLSHNCTQIWFQALLRSEFQPHHWDTLVRRNQLCTNLPRQSLWTENREVSFACVNWVSDSAVTGSASVPVCSGRTLLCTGLYRNHNLGPHSSTTALQIQVWMRSTALLPRCFLPQMWMWDASFSPPWGKCYVQKGRIEPRPAPSPPALHPTSAHKHMHEEWSRTRFHL